jgi:hypothetical protein
MRASMISSQSFLWLYLFSDGDYQAGTHSPYVLRLSRSVIVYLRRILRALHLHKKIEYTARIAPAQLGKAIVNRYRRPAATGRGRQVSGVRSLVSGNTLHPQKHRSICDEHL